MYPANNYFVEEYLEAPLKMFTVSMNDYLSLEFVVGFDILFTKIEEGVWHDFLPVHQVIISVECILGKIAALLKNLLDRLYYNLLETLDYIVIVENGVGYHGYSIYYSIVYPFSLKSI